MSTKQDKSQGPSKENRWTFNSKVFQTRNNFVDYLKKAAEARDPMSLGALIQLRHISMNIGPNSKHDFGITHDDLDAIDTAHAEAIEKIGVSGIPELVRLIREDPLLRPSVMKVHWLHVAQSIAETNPGREELSDLLNEAVELVKPLSVRMQPDAVYASSVKFRPATLHEFKRWTQNLNPDKPEISDTEAALQLTKLMKEFTARMKYEDVDLIEAAVDAIRTFVIALPQHKKPLEVLVPLFENLQTHIPFLRTNCINTIRELTGSNPILTDRKGKT